MNADSGRRRVARCTSASSKSDLTSSQNGLGSRGTPSSLAASRTRTRRSARACRPCRRGSDRARRHRVARAGRRAHAEVVVQERRRPPRRGNAPSSRPRTKTTSNAACARARSRAPRPFLAPDSPPQPWCARARRGRPRSDVAAPPTRTLRGRRACARRPGTPWRRREPRPKSGARRRPRRSAPSLEQSPRGGDRIGVRPKLDERRNGRAAKPLALLLDPGRIGDGAPAEPPFDEVHRSSLEPRVGRAEEREEIAALSAAPDEAQQREQRAPERGLARRPACSIACGTPSRERRLERRAPALRGLADHADSSGAPLLARADDLTRKELGRSARAAPSRKRIAPSRAGPYAGASAKSSPRDARARAASTDPERGSSSIAPPARGPRDPPRFAPGQRTRLGPARRGSRP